MAKTRAHHMVKFYFGWQFCCTCGLMYLKNDVSRREAKKPCPGKVDE